MSVFSRALRAGEGKKVKRLAEIVPFINELEEEYEALSDDELRHQTTLFKERLERGEELDDLLVEAFGTLREASWRVLGQRHFDVQLMGGMALHFGWIAEMKTGEGKTLVSTLPVYLNGLAGKGVHVVTVNDYLATRDAAWMGQLHQWMGLSVGRVGQDIDDNQMKLAAYRADVTYGTNNEFGFDYLRDNLMMSRETMAQRGHNFAIIDEVDSILIDEARTPLIISLPADEAAKTYYQFAGIARGLKRDADYEVDEEKRHVVPVEEGIEKVEKILGLENLYESVSTNYVHHLIKALEAKELYRRDKEYMVQGGEVKIVDEFTGRALDGRRWSDGLHQAVEAKEGVRINEENHTAATVTLQNYFRQYEKLGGMTGTAETEASEFASTYNLPVVPIPTNRQMVRIDQPDLVFKTEAEKFDAVVEDIIKRRESGQPVLVGTASVAKSEQLSKLLKRSGVPHEVLNAKQHFREAEIVAQAGRLGAVTVATNMAGRGVDILLGGNPELLARHEVTAGGTDIESEEGKLELKELEAKFDAICKAEGEQVRQAGGLYVLGSERHESRRIDNQLRGRSGRQGDSGESRFMLSLEDDLMRLFATGLSSFLFDKAIPEGMALEFKMIAKAIEKAQNTVEAKNSEIRKDVLKYDEVKNEQRKIIYARRLQVIDGADLYEKTLELIESTIDDLGRAYCPHDFPEDWDLPGLLVDLNQYYPTQFSEDDLSKATTAAQVIESVLVDVLEYYQKKSDSYLEGEGQARTIERMVMLQIIDQRWRDHLVELDHLFDGINLRAVANQDPLVVWQQEGFEMFGKLLEAIDDDYLKYLLHIEAVDQTQVAGPNLSGATYAAAEDPVLEAGAMSGVVQAESGVSVAGTEGVVRSGQRELSAVGALGRASSNQNQGGTMPSPADTLIPHKKGDQEKLGRNDPCWCGSGRKYKLCHGTA